MKSREGWLELSLIDQLNSNYYFCWPKTISDDVGDVIVDDSFRWKSLIPTDLHKTFSFISRMHWFWSRAASSQRSSPMGLSKKVPQQITKKGTQLVMQLWSCQGIWFKSKKHHKTLECFEKKTTSLTWIEQYKIVCAYNVNWTSTLTHATLQKKQKINQKFKYQLLSPH